MPFNLIKELEHIDLTDLESMIEKYKKSIGGIYGNQEAQEFVNNLMDYIYSKRQINNYIKDGREIADKDCYKELLNSGYRVLKSNGTHFKGLLSTTNKLLRKISNNKELLAEFLSYKSENERSNKDNITGTNNQNNSKNNSEVQGFSSEEKSNNQGEDSEKKISIYKLSDNNHDDDFVDKEGKTDFQRLQDILKKTSYSSSGPKIFNQSGLEYAAKNDNESTNDDDVVFNNGRNNNKSNVTKNEGSNKRTRVSIINVKKPKNKSKLIKRLIAASLAIVTFVATGSVISRLFNKNDISQSSDSSISVASSVDSTSKEESKDQGNKTLNNVKEVSNDTKKEENSKVESSSNEVMETSKVENSNTKTEEDSKVDNSNTKKEDTSKTEKTDKIDDKRENVTDSRADSVSKSDSYINIGDKVTLKDDIIYTDVYSAADSNNGAPAYFDNNMERTVSSILLTNGQDKYYSINKDEVDKKINEGWAITSAVISNNGGIEGAEPISNLVEVTKNISNDTASESVDNKQKDDTSKKIEESSEKVSNSSDDTKKENDNKENVTDSDTLDNIKGNISKIMDEKKDDKDTSDSISNNVRKIMAEKASIGDKVTIDKDVIYKDIYSASIKENGLPAYHDNNKVRSISSVLLTKNGLSYYSSNQEEINDLRKQGWVVKAVLIANENGLEGFEPIDNLNEFEENSVGGRHL